MTDTEKTHYEQGARFDSFDGKPVDAPGAGRVPGEELLKSLMPQTKSQRQRGWEAVDKNMR